MTIERLMEVIAAYGSNPQRWPADERQSALTLLGQSQEAQSLLASQQILDSVLDSYIPVEMPQLFNIILNQQLPPHPQNSIDSLINWLMPDPRRLLSTFWRPTVAACLPLLFGLYLGNYFSFGVEVSTTTWEQELALLSLNDYAESAQ